MTNNKKIILGFVGPIAAGKGTACQYLKEKYGANTYRFSSILRDIVDRLYLPQSRENLQKISSVLRQNFGDDLLALAIAKDVAADNGVIVAVDGVRRMPDIKYLQKIPGFYLIYVDTDQKNRYERIIKRGENTDDNKKTFAQFQEDEKQESEQQIQEVAKSAKFILDNNGSPEDTRQGIEKIIKKINDLKD
jgi:dephospho-CoA kinase